MSINNPLGTSDIYKYGGHTPENLGTINNSSGIINPHIQTGGNLPSTVSDLQGRYNFDIHDLVTSRYREDFPILTLADLNGSSWNMVIYPFSEDYDGDVQYHNMFINDLRTRDASVYAIGNASEVGGKLEWKDVPTAVITDLNTIKTTGTNADNATIVDTSTTNDEKALFAYGSDKVLALGVGVASGAYILGLTSNFITKMIALLQGMEYTQRGGNGVAYPLTNSGATESWGGFTHGTNAKTVTLLFNDLALNIDGVDYQEHEITVRLEAFWYDTTGSKAIILANFSKTNLRQTLGTTNTILLEEMHTSATTVLSGFTRLDHEALLGMYNTIPSGVKEGSSASDTLQTGLQYGFESKENYMQIFRSNPLEITGTRLASGNYRIDDVKRNRDKMLFLYKKDKANTYIWGKKSQSMGSDGKVTRTMSGMLDYELAPIKYIKATLNRYGAVNYSEAIKAFVKKIAYSHNAFKPKASNEVITALCSNDMLEALDEIVKLSYGQAPNLHGYTTQQPYRDNAVDLGIKHFDFPTMYGTVRFIREPILDYLTEFQLPYFMTGGAWNPRYIMLLVDKSYISTKTLRPDKLQGNIQDNDEDLSREDIIGESTLEILYPKMHSIILASIT